jgi:hypothetical protein
MEVEMNGERFYDLFKQALHAAGHEWSTMENVDFSGHLTVKGAFNNSTVKFEFTIAEGDEDVSS